MKWIVFILIALPLLCKGQGNLVPNGGFEELWSCPSGIGQVELAIPWINDIGGCEVYNECVEPTFIPPNHYQHRQDVPENSVGYQYAHSGVGYAGIFTYGGMTETSGREYLQVPLLEPLQSGGYIISFWASLADNFQYAVGSLGAYLSDTLIIREQYNSVLEGEPSIQSPAGLIMSDKDIWYHITDTFASRYGGEQYLLIGNFKSTAESDTLLVPTGANNRFQSYYYIDDVSVVALGDTVSGISPPTPQRGELAVLPNPSNGIFEVRSSEPLKQSGTLILYDAQGRAVLRHNVQKGMTNVTIDAIGITTGLYNLRLQLDDGSSGWEKVVVQ